MYTADNGGLLWPRRDFLTAMGAGVMASSIPLKHLTRQSPDVVIYFNGAILYSRDPDGKYCDVFLPLAEGAGITDQHPDSTHAVPHAGYLAIFESSASGKPQLVGTPYHLLGADVSLISAKPATASFVDVPGFKKFTSKTIIRDFNSSSLLKYFAARIRLVGGAVTPFIVTTPGVWEFSKVLNNDAPTDLLPAIGIIWEAGQPEVAVQGGSMVNLPPKLAGVASNRAYLLGHLPGEPAKWFDAKHHIYPGKVDHDFKWLYRIVVPKGTKETDKDPWPAKLKDRLLPAPRNVVPPPLVISAKTNVGSPNCFGGCFGC